MEYNNKEVKGTYLYIVYRNSLKSYSEKILKMRPQIAIAFLQFENKSWITLSRFLLSLGLLQCITALFTVDLK